MSEIDKEQLTDSTDIAIEDTSVEVHKDALDEDISEGIEHGVDTTDEEVKVEDTSFDIDDIKVDTDTPDEATEVDEKLDSEDNDFNLGNDEVVDFNTDSVDDESEDVVLDDEEESDDVELDEDDSETEDAKLDTETNAEEESLEQEPESDGEVVIDTDEESDLEQTSDIEEDIELNTDKDFEAEEDEDIELDVDQDSEVDTSQDTDVQSSLENIGDSAKKSFYALREWQQARSALKEAKRKLETIEVELADQQSLYDMRRNVEANYDSLTSDNETKSLELNNEINEKEELVDTLKSNLKDLEIEYNKDIKACEEQTNLTSTDKSKAKGNLASMTSILKDTERRRVVTEGRLKDIKIKRANKIETLNLEIREANRMAQKYTDNARALSVGDKARCIEVKEKAEVQRLKAERLTEELEVVTKELDAKVAFTTKSFEDADAEFNKAKANLAKAKDEYDNVAKVHAQHEAKKREITDEYEANKKGLEDEIAKASTRIDECTEEIETVASYQLQMDSIISSPEKTRALSNKVAHLKEDLESQASDVEILEDNFSEIDERTTRERKILIALLVVVLLLIILSFQ